MNYITDSCLLVSQFYPLFAQVAIQYCQRAYRSGRILSATAQSMLSSVSLQINLLTSTAHCKRSQLSDYKNF